MDKKEITKITYELQNILFMMRRAHLTSNAVSNEKLSSMLKDSEIRLLYLFAVFNEGKPVSPSEIAKKTHVTFGAISHHINSLEKKGLIKRTTAKDNKRVVYITLTEKGQKLVKVIEKAMFKKIYKLVEFLGENDSIILVRLISKISEFANNQNNM